MLESCIIDLNALPKVKLFLIIKVLCTVYILYVEGSTFTQGPKGIRQWPINKCTSPKMMHKSTPSEDNNLNTQPYKPTN